MPMLADIEFGNFPLSLFMGGLLKPVGYEHFYGLHSLGFGADGGVLMLVACGGPLAG